MIVIMVIKIKKYKAKLKKKLKEINQIKIVYNLIDQIHKI